MTKWAVLIGIDSYPAHQDLTLRGCVNDVRTTSKLLVERYGFERPQMIELTSPAIDDPGTLGELRLETTPTYANIISGVRAVHDQCKRGDLVYFHFSGYGCTMPSIVPQFSDYPTYLDMTLVPVNVLLAAEQKYLHDIEISFFAKQFIDKGCEVTLVLDCRQYIRSDTDRSRYTCLTTEELNSVSLGKWRSTFGMPVKDTWMWDPSPKKAYTLISSFDYDGQIWGDFGRGYELQDPATSEWHGFLTAWLQQALDAAASSTFRNLFHYIEMRAQKLFGWRDPPRTPFAKLAVAGNTRREYPGGQGVLLQHLQATFSAALTRSPSGDKSLLRTAAGTAHGLRAGDSLLAFQWTALNTGGNDYHETYIGPFTASVVSAFSSIATSDTVRDIPRTAEHVDVFVIIASTSRKARILDDFATNKHSDSLPLKLAQEFRVDTFNRLLHLQHEARTLSKLADVNIVGGYRYDNTAHVVHPDYSKDGTFHLLSGDHIALYICNITDQELYFSVLHFDSADSLDIIHPPAIGYSTLLHPRDPAIKRYRLAFEDEEYGNEKKTKARQILKVIVTNQPTSFEGLQMNNLRVLSQSEEQEQKESRVEYTLSMYGKRDNVPESEEWMPRHAPDLTSETQIASDLGEWCCRDLVLMIHGNADSLKAALEDF
ncbi:hypothetical protein N0V93_005487 [Gnomoniopsis smithogilvyi]|uniref:Peptidase C14 caspase domain-containing protein n=1 Tax=Gnomoniopsis smithogilvyi TaxID=1191159 RepID=A0A9W8YSZ1_9PEZI|nr:hypothetical protein N0V93_005487 [Gnomoniopsis smithogilvyi]